MSDAADRERFTLIFQACAVRVFAYARRHTRPDGVEDVVSDTFMIAWRRLEDVPADALPWLLAVARKVIANQHRRLVRQDRLAVELAALERAVAESPSVDDVVIGRDSVLAALGDLTVLERDALLLTGWDGLSDVQAAQVMGCTPRAFRVRLHRARRRLERSVADREPGGEATNAHVSSLDALLGDLS